MKGKQICLNLQGWSFLQKPLVFSEEKSGWPGSLEVVLNKIQGADRIRRIEMAKRRRVQTSWIFSPSVREKISSC